jgi:hypothetical protein
MTPKSNKSRGPVKISNESSPGTTKTANPQRKDPNQAQGPRGGNSGTPSKQRSFLEEKSDRSSRFQQLADMVSSAFGKRGAGMKPHLEDALEPISGNTNVGRRKK